MNASIRYVKVLLLDEEFFGASGIGALSNITGLTTRGDRKAAFKGIQALAGGCGVYRPSKDIEHIGLVTSATGTLQIGLVIKEDKENPQDLIASLRAELSNKEGIIRHGTAENLRITNERNKAEAALKECADIQEGLRKDLAQSRAVHVVWRPDDSNVAGGRYYHYTEIEGTLSDADHMVTAGELNDRLNEIQVLKADNALLKKDSFTPQAIEAKCEEFISTHSFDNENEVTALRSFVEACFPQIDLGDIPF